MAETKLWQRPQIAQKTRIPTSSAVGQPYNKLTCVKGLVSGFFEIGQMPCIEGLRLLPCLCPETGCSFVLAAL